MCIPLVVELSGEGENKSPENTVSPVKPSSFHFLLTQFKCPENFDTLITSLTPSTYRFKWIQVRLPKPEYESVSHRDLLVLHLVCIVEVCNLQDLCAWL